MMEKELPEGWVETTVKEVSQIKRGVSYKKEQASSISGKDSIYVLRGGNIQDGKIDFDTNDNVYVDSSLVQKHQLILKNDVVIVGSTGSRTLIGKAGIADEDLEKVSFGAFLMLLRTELIDSRFHSYFFLTKYYRNSISALAGGVNINNIRKEHIENLVFPLPPLAEQKRIAAKLDEAFKHIEILKSKLDRIPALLKQFKQTVLTHAVTGKLTEEWRKGKGLEEWKFEKAKDCCLKVQSGGTPKGSTFENEGVPFLKVYNIVNQNVDFHYRPQYVSDLIQNSQLKKSIAYPGDVLMNIVGPPLGKIAILPSEYPEWNINQAITLFRPNPYLLNTFLYYFFCEGSSVKSLINETRGVVGQVNISLSQCRDFDIPVPSKLEQEEIVRKITELFEFSDKVQSSFVSLKDKVDKLPQALLAKAFKGDLVSQDENEEVASFSLERISKLINITKK